VNQDSEIINKREFIQTLQKLNSDASSLVEKCYLSDIPLLYSPSQIAIGCILNCAGQEISSFLGHYLEKRFKDFEKLRPLLKSLEADIEAVSLPEKEEMREIVPKINSKYQKHMLYYLLITGQTTLDSGDHRYCGM
jgi:predicted lipase